MCKAVTPGGSLFWWRYTRKPANSLQKTCQQSTLIAGTMSYDLMRWKLICLVLVALSMCGGDQVRNTKTSVLCPQSSMMVRMSWSGAAWVLQVLESYISLRETHLQDNHCFTEEADGKGDRLAHHVSRLEPNRTCWGDPQADGGCAQSLKYPLAPRRRHGGVEEHSSGYLRSSGKLHAQESTGSSG